MTSTPAQPFPTPADIDAAIFALTSARGLAGSVCPTEVARALQAKLRPGEHPGDGWQRLLAPVRRAADRLALAGRVEILRKGRPVHPKEARGVIRLRQAAPQLDAA